MKEYKNNGKSIFFDDYTEQEDKTTHSKFWSQICQHCLDKHKETVPYNIICDGGSGICGVLGCKNEADYYIDFPMENFS